MRPILLIKGTDNALINSIPADVYATQKIIAQLSPFVPIPVYICIKITCVKFLIRFIEIMIGTRLFIKNELLELFFIDSRIRSLLLKLARKRIIVSWHKVPQRADAPQIIHYRIELGAITLPSGEQVHIGGSQGSGAGDTESEALMLALAEGLERYSTAVWDTKKIIRGSYTKLAQKGALNPRLFSFFSDSQLKRADFSRSIISDEKEIGWVQAYSFLNKTKCLVPAQLIYLFYDRAEPDDFHFYDISTSGVAIHSSYNRSVYRAICEIVERDSVMIFWLNKLTPPRIELDSITIPKVQEKIKNLRLYGFELYILDITTDLKIPAFCAVLIDIYGDVAVSMSAVAGYDVENSLDRLMVEIMKFVHLKSKKNAVVASAIEKQPENIRSFKDRLNLWSSPKMIGEINFFISGKEEKFSEVMEKSVSAEESILIDLIRKIFQEKNYQCYIADVTSKDAEEEGLVAIRAISPDLVPVFFNEKEKPCGVKRLYTCPVTMKYKDTPTTEATLNRIPHPFP